MADTPPDDSNSAPDSGRPKRAPPTIDLEASEVTERSASGGEGSTRGSRGWSFGALPRPSMAGWSAVLMAGATGAVAALLVIAAVWSTGWLGHSPQPVAQPHNEEKAIGLLSSRIDDLETRVSRPGATDQASSQRLEAMEKSIASLRSELAGARARADKLAGELDAALLNLAVRQGEPFKATLEAAKTLARDPDALKPLNEFAGTGVPNPASLTRELLTLVPKLSPPAPASTTGAGIIDRLQAGASKLVRIERTDATGSDRGAIVARITAAAVRNDLADSRRELEQLSVEDRKPAQAWLDKAKERDAALAAAHQFVNEAMAELAKGAP